MAKIRIVIEKGRVSYDVTETKGESCLELTKPFKDALGLPEEASETVLKPEFYEGQEYVEEGE